MMRCGSGLPARPRPPPRMLRADDTVILGSAVLTASPNMLLSVSNLNSDGYRDHGLGAIGDCRCGGGGWCWSFCDVDTSHDDHKLIQVAKIFN